MAVSPEAVEFVSEHGYMTDLATAILDGVERIDTPFDDILFDTLDRTFLPVGDPDRISRLIINIPPGFGKTSACVWAYVARGFAINPSSRFIHVSYSDKLVQDNSSKIRDIINHEDYQQLYPYVNFKEDSKAKGLWRTDRGGAFLASPSGGSITGFRAGMVKSVLPYSGAMIADDVLKPDDAQSETRREFVNSRWHGTFKSRLATPDVPVILIMQRIHEHDFTHELIENSGEEWHHLVLPIYIDPAYEYTQSGRYIDHGLPEGSLWDVKATDKLALSLMEEIQYSQEPTPAKGEVYEREWFNRYKALPPHIKRWSIYCDTASKTNKYNDYSVFQLWALTVENKGYLVKQWREKVKIPYLLGELKDFYEQAIEISGQRSIDIAIEDKDSGVGLIQAMELESDERGNSFYIEPIQRKEGKYARAVKAAPKIKDGKLYIPAGPMGDGLITEATKFKADDSHKHDDQIDPMNDFVNFELPDSGYTLANL